MREILVSKLVTGGRWIDAMAKILATATRQRGPWPS